MIAWKQITHETTAAATAQPQYESMKKKKKPISVCLDEVYISVFRMFDEFNNG